MFDVGISEIMVIAVVALVLLVSSTTKDAQKVSDQFVVAVQNGDGAKAYAHAVGISEEHALARIWEGFEAERNAPTDIPTQLPLKGEMN